MHRVSVQVATGIFGSTSSLNLRFLFHGITAITSISTSSDNSQVDELQVSVVLSTTIVSVIYCCNITLFCVCQVQIAAAAVWIGAAVWIAIRNSH